MPWKYDPKRGGWYFEMLPEINKEIGEMVKRNNESLRKYLQIQSPREVSKNQMPKLLHQKDSTKKTEK